MPRHGTDTEWHCAQDNLNFPPQPAPKLAAPTAIPTTATAIPTTPTAMVAVGPVQLQPSALRRDFPALLRADTEGKGLMYLDGPGGARTAHQHGMCVRRVACACVGWGVPLRGGSTSATLSPTPPHTHGALGCVHVVCACGMGHAQGPRCTSA